MARGTVEPRGTTWPFMRLGPDEWARLGELQAVVEDVAVTKARELLAELARREQLKPIPAAMARERGRGPASAAAVEGAPACLQRWWGVDSYRGTWAQLVEAGVVTEGEKPGLPGNGVNQITVAPDGTRRTKGASGGQTMAPGTRTIRRTGKERYIVDLRVSEAEEKRRHDEHMRQNHPSQRRHAAAQAGGPSQQAAKSAQRAAGGHLRLAWSAG